MLFPSLRTLIKCIPLTISEDLDYTVTSEKLRSIILVLVDFFLENRYTKVEDRRKRTDMNLHIKLNNPCSIYFSLFSIWFFKSPELIMTYTRSMLNLPIFPQIFIMKKIYYKKCYLLNSSLGELLRVQMASQSLKIWTQLSLKWGLGSIFQRFLRLSD